VGSKRIRVCFDTCHAFAAGHKFARKAEVEATLAHFDAVVGLDKLAVIHLNDSKGECGRHLDRHEHIGQGHIGREAMSALLRHPALQRLPFILETPEVETMVETNLNTMRELRAA
jgi:deoxyribonuclease-4